MMRVGAAVALLVLLSSGIARGEEAVDLDDATFESVRDRILPSKDEERWREIPWRASAWEAVVEAAEAEKPVLLWAMNGHPLGCT